MKRGFHERFSVVMKDDEANSVCKFIKVNLKERESLSAESEGRTSNVCGTR